MSAHTPNLNTLPEDIRTKIWRCRKRPGSFEMCFWFCPPPSGAFFFTTMR